MAYDRFRVRGMNHQYNEPGPDLLREQGNARARVRALIAQRHDGWTAVAVKADGTRLPQTEPMSKAEALDVFDHWAHEPTATLVLSHRGEPAIGARYERVEKIETPNCSPDTVLNRSLIAHQFPHARYAGGYVYRTVKDSESWSDHAWGTAIDDSENPPDPTNDELTDWCARMGRAGCMHFDYLLGSEHGKVVQVSAPDYAAEPSTAASSHLWHVHMSVVDHDGRKPPRQGGVW